MPRVLGVEIPGRKRIEYALRYIHGIGPARARAIVDEAKLDPAKNPQVVTLHDPCNLVRLGGIVEEQRFILRHAVENFVEMIPNRDKNFCCGGGGGQLAMTRFADRRIKTGKIKADQIKATGAKIVATPCHNCIDQLMELNKHYKLGVEIKTVTELAASALILDR